MPVINEGTRHYLYRKNLKSVIGLLGHCCKRSDRAIAEPDRQYKLKGIIELDDVYFGTKNKGRKRGRGTTKPKVLVAVSTDVEKEHAGFVKMEMVEKLDMDTVSKFVKENIECGSKIQTNDLDRYNSLADFRIEPEEYSKSIW